MESDSRLPSQVTRIVNKRKERVRKALSRDKTCFHLGPWRELRRDEPIPTGEIIFTKDGNPLVPVRSQERRK